MRVLTFWMVLMISAGALAEQNTPKRPKITGIDHVTFYTTAADQNQHLYETVLGLSPAQPLEPGQSQGYSVGSQWVGYSAPPDGSGTNRLNHVAFRTEDCDKLRAYLAAKGVKVPDANTSLADGTRTFSVKDPEGNTVEFRQSSGANKAKKDMGQTSNSDPVSRRIIHFGFIVHDPATEDRFYKDILGFRAYWHGGMQPSRTDWVSIQVPDGTDWIEYMLNIKPDADQHLKGVMNHFSLGVNDMNAAQMKLESHGWKPHGDEHSQIGRDGKLQLNVWDPDQTRIELMEFKPVDKPCCSEFVGTHPSEND